MSTTDTVQPRFINRELSWLEFNARVLHQALRSDVPLLERLKFLCIVTSNFDEFFMVRVASVKRQIKNGDFSQCPSGIIPSVLLDRILKRTRELVDQKYRCLVDEVLPGLAASGVVLRRSVEYTTAQASFITKLFQEEIFPVLTPVRATEGQEVPYVANLRLHAAFIVEPQQDANLISEGGGQTSGNFLAIVQIPSSLDRVIFLPDEFLARNVANRLRGHRPSVTYAAAGFGDPVSARAWFRDRDPLWRVALQRHDFARRGG
ncbi:MAG: hypothetical protein ACOC2Q_05185, partial [Spirochaetota bacterium]